VTTNSTESETVTEDVKTWTDAEVNTLVEDLKEEKNQAIDEAVQKATAPILADNYTMNIELEFYRKNWADVDEIINAYKNDNDTLKNICIFGGIGLGILSFFAGYGVAQMVGG
jgi:hypothetical protein